MIASNASPISGLKVIDPIHAAAIFYFLPPSLVFIKISLRFANFYVMHVLRRVKVCIAPGQSVYCASYALVRE